MTFKKGDLFERRNVRLHLAERDDQLQLWRVTKIRRWPWTKCWPRYGFWEQFEHTQWWSDGDLAKRVSKFTKVN